MKQASEFPCCFPLAKRPFVPGQFSGTSISVMVVIDGSSTPLTTTRKVECTDTFPGSGYEQPVPAPLAG
jgi:hypothetical protein